MKIFNASLVLLLIFLLSACVSSKKYDLLREERNAFRLERDSLRLLSEEGRYKGYELERTKVELEQQNEKFDELKTSFDALEKNYKDLLDRYDEIIFQNQSLLAATSDEKVNMTTELARKQFVADSLMRLVHTLQVRVGQKDAQIDQLSSQEGNLDEAEAVALECQQRLADLNNMIANKDAVLNSLRSKVNQALLGFNTSDLKVSEANGKIYVSLSQNLLFKPGSDQIDWKGKQAIQKLAEVLKRNPDIQIGVEGHTDSDGSASANWDLSVRRATAVVKVLTGYGVNPKSVTASGRGEHFPVATNSSADGKARNRRTEIILSPNLDALYRIINQ